MLYNFFSSRARDFAMFELFSRPKNRNRLDPQTTRKSYDRACKRPDTSIRHTIAAGFD